MNAMPPDPAFRGDDWRERLARPPRGDAAVAHRVAAPAARRAVLATRLARARLRRDRGGRPQRRRLDGFVRRRRDAHAGSLHRPEPDDRRQLGPRLAVVGEPRTGDRRAPRGRAVLRPLAEGDPERRRRGARHHLVRARIRGARAVPGDASPGDGERLRRIRIRPSWNGRGVSRRGSMPLAGTLTDDDRDDGAMASIATATDRRSGRARPCPGVPAARPTVSPATSGRTSRSVRHTRRSRSTAAVEILGVPRVVLHLAVSAPVATAVVRLTDVAPDGTSAQVTAGILNLTHRRSHAEPEPLVPGSVEEIVVDLRPAGYRWLPGHRIRVSVASSAWPVVWPSPFAAEFELHRGAATPSRLVLPVVPPAGGPGDTTVPTFKTTPPALLEVGGEGDDGRARLAHHGRRHRRDRDRHGPRRRRGHPRRRAAAVRRGDADDDRVRRGPGAARPWTPTSSTAGGTTTSRPRSGRARSRRATPRRSTSASTSRSTSTASRSSGGPGANRSSDVSSDDVRARLDFRP